MPQGGLDEASTFVDVDDILSDTRSWLEGLVEEERSRAGWGSWGSEFRFERSPVRPERISDEDRAVLDRISRCEGPRPFEYEDILAPLRLRGSRKYVARTAPSFSETYKDQLNILDKWNRKVASVPNLDKEREELYDRLEERCQMIANVETRRRIPGEFDAQSSRLRKALRRFRPEVATFEHRSCLSVLVVIVAHVRVARPDIDLEMRDKMVETIFREMRLMVRTEKQHDVRDRQLEARLQTAYESEDRTVADCLRREKKDLAKKDRTFCTEKTIDRLKVARKSVQQRVLAELQDLAVQQAGMKRAAYERLTIPYSLLQESLDTDGVVKRMQEHLLNAEAACDADFANVANMLDLAYGCHDGTKRFAGKDVESVSNRERERIKWERMEDPKTYSMMMRVVDDGTAVSQIPGVVTAHMTKLDESLELALGVAKEQFRKLGGWERALLDEDTEVDLGLALAGKVILEASAKGTGRFGYRTEDDAEGGEAEVNGRLLELY